MSSKTCLLLIYYQAIIVASVLGIQTSPDANYVSFPASENGTCYKRLLYNDELANNISAGLIQLVSGSQSAPIKSTGSGAGRDWITVIDCCDGYTRDPQTGRCETHCEEGCFGGQCVGPNQCQCDEGWHVEAGTCKPECQRPCAENAYCFSPGVCSCLFGFEERGGICTPLCLHDCENGECVAPRKCQCYQGYTLNETQHCEPVCESGCPHGQCYRPEMCLCDEGYETSRFTPETCVPRCPDTCINKGGECETPDVCTCKPGYEEDNDGNCQPVCGDECENGQCVAPETCQCDPPFVLDPQTRKCVARRGGSYHQSNYQDTGYGHSTTNGPPLTGPHYVTNSPTGPYGAVSTYRPHSSDQHPNSRDRPDTYGEQQSSRPHYQTSSPRNPYGPVSTYRPQGSNRYQEVRDGADNFGVIPLDQNSELQQGAIHSRNREPDNQQRPPGSRDEYRDDQQWSHIQKIDGPTRSPLRPDNSRGGYGNDQSTQEPQRSITESGSISNHNSGRGREPYGSSTPSYGYGNSQTYERPRPDQENLHGPRDRDPSAYGNYGQRINQTHKLQGPFPPQSSDSTQDRRPNVNHSHWTDNDRSRQSPQSSNLHNQRPYDTGYDQAQNPRGSTIPTQRPYQPQSYNQAHNPQNSISSTQRPYDNHGYGRPQDANRPHYQPDHFQETLTESDNIEASTRPYHNQNRPYDQNQGRYNTPQRQQGNYGSQSPYSTASPNTHQTEAYDTASQRYPYHDKSTSRPNVGQGSSSDGYQQGYGRNRLPSEQSTTPYPSSRYPNQGRGRESPTELSRPVYGGMQSQPQLQNRGNYDVNFDMINHAGSDGIVQGLPVDGLVIPVINQYGAFCEVPCLNGQCIGPNVCLCNAGYGPDLNNPYTAQCVPMCSEGCINGVCTAPNLCICNAGFRKEYGVKGSNHCVPNI